MVPHYFPFPNHSLLIRLAKKCPLKQQGDDWECEISHQNLTFIKFAGDRMEFLVSVHFGKA